MAVLTVDRTIEAAGDHTTIADWLTTTSYDLTAAIHFSYDGLTGGPFTQGEGWTAAASRAGTVGYDDGTDTMVVLQSAGPGLSNDVTITGDSSLATCDVNGSVDSGGVIERGLVGAEERSEVNNWTAGATVDGTRHRRLESIGSALHAGAWDEAKGHLTTSGSTDHILHITEDWVHLKGLQIYQAGSGDSHEGVRVEADNVLIEKCLIRVNNIGSQDCIYTGATAVDELQIFDCVLVQDTAGGVPARGCIHHQIFTGSPTQVIRVGATTMDADGGTYGLRADEGAGTLTVHVDNCYAARSGSGDFSAGGTPDVQGDGNKSEDTSARTVISATGNNENSVTLTATDSGGAASYLVTSLTSPGDYQLLEGAAVDNAAIDEAVDETQRDSRIDILLDVAGNTRDTTFTLRDVGAFDVAAAPPAGGTPPALTLLGVG